MTSDEQLSIIYKLFPSLSERQKSQLEQLEPLYRDWNSKINIISRKDIDNLYLHHVLHSLGITQMLHFVPETHVIDVGTGGGFPGIPLAILFPKVSFTLVDSIGKKIRVAESIAQSIGLTNVTCLHGRIEQLKLSCHFVVTRATMPLPELVPLVRNLFKLPNINALPNGVLALKGGNLEGEAAAYKRSVMIEDLYPYLPDEYFLEKKLLYLPL